MTNGPRPTLAEIVELFGLQPLPVEGGLFVQTWRSIRAGEIVGTATIAALTDEPDSFSAMHRLPVDEVWHFYLGNPIDVLMLHDDGSVTSARLGHGILEGDQFQLVVPAGTWMGAELAPRGRWALFGNTMAPGFRSSFYEGGERDDLIRRWPAAAAHIERLTRPGQPTEMQPGL